MGVHTDYNNTADRVPGFLRRLLPAWARRFLVHLYWLWYDARDFLVEAIGWIPFHSARLFLYRVFAHVRIGRRTSIHRGCRFYCPASVQLGHNSIINRNVLLDGRMGLTIGNNVSISEGVAIFTLEHDPNCPEFTHCGAPIVIHDRAFIGARAIILPGVTLNEGSVVAAGAVVTHDVAAYTIVGGVPAKPIGERCTDLTYRLDYRKFLG
jgi:acetyltransferase-like isoleucine patch superfamily enzyme